MRCRSNSNPLSFVYLASCATPYTTTTPTGTRVFSIAMHQEICTAEEMQCPAIRANTITFFPSRSDKDDLHSKSCRFERLLHSDRGMKMHILHCAAKAGCVTSAMVDKVAAHFPGIARYYRQAYGAIKN
ncbi:hypothetical protein EJ02DRAFT_50899 [Clathrospora elynae]|uniref:Uncharacterized protein n=1 Tax=Clathrospora elynae TaxID=706981 RepID=A0A6A5SC81_9PLEO|nr:hypothetical protein EJ02DRAFT_50899 [Clathrospora elynae]